MRIGEAASSTFSTSEFSRPVFTDTASTNCCLVICSSVLAIAHSRPVGWFPVVPGYFGVVVLTVVSATDVAAFLSIFLAA